MRSDHGSTVPYNLPPQETGDRCWVPLTPLHPFPPSGQPGQGPTTPLHRATQDWPRWKPRFGLQIWVRSHCSGTTRPNGAFLAKRHLSTRSDSWARDQRRLTSALLYSASLWKTGRPVQPGLIHGRPVRERSLYKESHYTLSSLSHSTRRCPHLQTHREETLQRDQGENRLLRRLAG